MKIRFPRLTLSLVLTLAIASGAFAVQPLRDAACDHSSAIDDLPIIEVPTHGSSERVAIFLSGDGGWRAIDRKVTDEFARQGVPTAGLDSASYLHERKSPEELSCAVGRMMRHYSTVWKREHFILVGYSRGAGLLPFAIARLPENLRSRIDTVALLGLDPTIDFKVNTSALLWNAPDELQIPVRPEMEKLRGLRVLCFRGETEKDSLCNVLPPALATQVIEPGGHHFAGRYEDLAGQILRGGR